MEITEPSERTPFEGKPDCPDGAEIRFILCEVFGKAKWFGFDYHPRMRVGNVFGHVCLSVCLCVCLSVCVCVCVFCLFRL